MKWVARAYVSVALRGVDRKILTPEDEDDLELDDEQLEAISKPFAHLANKSEYLTKHGRMIIDSRDAVEASVVMFMWMGRVNRISRKYKPKHRRSETDGNKRSGQDVAQEQAQGPVAGYTAPGHGYN